MSHARWDAHALDALLVGALLVLYLPSAVPHLHSARQTVSAVLALSPSCLLALSPSCLLALSPSCLLDLSPSCLLDFSRAPRPSSLPTASVRFLACLADRLLAHR